jgi:hypothetical protein
MGVVTLQYIMEKDFHNIKTKFKRASLKNGIIFDEDIFIDTYLKCCDYLKDTNMDEKQIIQYYWVSFVNNTKKEAKKKIYKVEETYIEDSLQNDDDSEYINELEIIDETYDDRRYRVYDFIIDYVKNNFDEQSFKSWYLHFVNNIDYEKLKSMGYTNINFHNVFRNINNAIKNKLPKENKEYKTIIKEIF